MNDTHQMNEMNQTNERNVPAPLYRVDGVGYRLEPLSWQQTKWLGEHIFAGIDLQALEYRVIHDLLREKGPLFMAICLLPQGQTRAQQARQPWTAIEALAQTFAGELSGEEVAHFGIHFFRHCGASQLAILVSGAALQRAAISETDNGQRSDASGASGSSPVLSPLPTAISLSSVASLPTGDPLIPVDSLSVPLNGAPRI